MEEAVSGREATSTGFRWLISTTCVATYALIVLGGAVRATGSGDACPDWPRCHGELIPPFESAVLIEFSHRLLASLVGFLVLATAVVAWRSLRHVPLIRWGSVAAVVLVGGQIVLGGMTVLNDLPSSLVTAHLALAAILLATLLGIVLVAFVPSTRDAVERQEGGAGFRNLAVFTAVAVFALMLTGSYVSGSGAGLAFRDWPLFDGRLLPEGGRLAMIHATHRLAAAAVGFLLLYVAARAWRSQPRHGLIAFASTLALALYVTQALVGAANVWTLLQPAAIAAHVALAAALWAALVVVALFAHVATQEAPKRGPAAVSDVAARSRRSLPDGAAEPAGRPL